jgi:hypothetical protein
MNFSDYYEYIIANVEYKYIRDILHFCCNSSRVIPSGYIPRQVLFPKSWAENLLVTRPDNTTRKNMLRVEISFYGPGVRAAQRRTAAL